MTSPRNEIAESLGLLLRRDTSDLSAVFLTLIAPGDSAVREMRQRLAETLDDYLTAWPPG